MASNEVEAFRRAQVAHKSAVSNKADKQTTGQLKAEMDAAAAKTATKDGRDW